MKINAQQSSIDCFHGQARDDKARQHNLILSVMDSGRDYSGRELSELTGLTPNIISARLFELREEQGRVERRTARRQCSVSGVSVFVHKLPARQLELI